MLLITDELVKSPISPPLAGGDKGEGVFDFSQNRQRYFELKSKKNKYWKISLIVFCFLASIVAWLGFSERGLIHLYHTEMERQSYIDRIRQLAEENQTLLEEVHRLRTDMKYVESIVKEQFNLLKPNEVVYRFNKAKTRDQKTKSK